MAANSHWRRLLKRALYPVLNERVYRVFQSAAMAWDIRSGKWSEPEIDLIPLAVRAGESAFDVGANYGLYCFHLSRAVGRSGRVYAFEPVPFTYATCALVARFLRIRNVELVPKGCSDRPGAVAFVVPKQGSGAISAGQAHLAVRNNERPGKEKHFRFDAAERVTCEVVALDDCFPELANVSFIKVDIEGADLLALRGADQIIRRHHPTIVCEINPWFLDGFGIRLEEFLRFFFDRDYQIYRYGMLDGRGRLERIDRAEIVEDNYVFVHPTRRNRFASLIDVSPRESVLRS